MSEVKKNSIILIEEETESVKAVSTSSKPEAVVYVGPTIVGVASHSMIFNNGISDTLEAAMEKEPAFKGLVVPMQSLATALLDLQNKTGATWALYNKVADYKL